MDVGGCGEWERVWCPSAPAAEEHSLHFLAKSTFRCLLLRGQAGRHTRLSQSLRRGPRITRWAAPTRGHHIGTLVDTSVAHSPTGRLGFVCRASDRYL